MQNSIYIILGLSLGFNLAFTFALISVSTHKDRLEYDIKVLRQRLENYMLAVGK